MNEYIFQNIVSPKLPYVYQLCEGWAFVIHQPNTYTKTE